MVGSNKYLFPSVIMETMLEHPIKPNFSRNARSSEPQHFTRGAIAVAVNGVPIFNPYTNTGVDAFLDGQLDNWEAIVVEQTIIIITLHLFIYMEQQVTPYQLHMH